MSTWPNRGVPPAAWQGPEDKKQQPKTNSPNRLTHRNTDSPSDADWALMRRIDELHLEHPFMGARMLRRMLLREGIRVGRHLGTSAWSSRR